MDDLTLLQQFRANVPQSLHGREQARARLERLIAPRPRRRSRLLVLVAAVALLIALGGTAYGLAREYLIGDPAPDPVKEQAAMLNEVKGELIPTAGKGAGIRVEETKLGAYLDASTGPVYIWVAPSAQGECRFMQVVGTELRDGGPNLSGGCGSAPGTRPLDWGTSITRVRDGRLLAVISGSVSEQVAKLELNSQGETVDVPLQGGYFLFEVEGGGRQPEPNVPPFELVAYDKTGGVLARDKAMTRFGMPAALGPVQRRPQPLDLGTREPLIEIATRRTRKPIRLYVFERGGERCRVLVSPGGTGSSCGGRPPQPNEVFVGPNQIGAAPTGMLLLWGEVGSDIRALELRFEDGRVEQLPLAKQFALYQVDPADFAAGRRPISLVGRDQNGKVAGERKLGPWRR